MSKRDKDLVGTVLSAIALALLSALLVLGVWLGMAAKADAQGARNCAPRDVVVERLAETYGETRQSVGLGANSALVETFASIETGTWTITITMANGPTCLVASGQSYEAVAEALPPEGDDT